MALCCWHRNGVVTFAAFFTVVGVLVIAAGRLWLSWAAVAQTAVQPEETGLQYRASPIDFKIFRLLSRRLERLSASEREAIAASRDLYEAKMIAISFVALGVVKTSLSVVLLVAALMLERVLQVFLFGGALVVGVAAMQAVGVEVVLLQDRPAMEFAMPATLTTRGAAIVLPVSAILYLGVDVLSLVCVRKFYCELRTQRLRPCALPPAAPI
ncbi:uncharacterized protein LOC124550964 isoform X2 [Schistocerca americana]|uniref:uncharacterized protein LOC124550964 isoform X2 n=1 Tax=Schistocerca americana TaxID=7009 RepID=UPI001F4F6B03|nr:uncharacterized protein LOC124550964 isoform X2 [Schistocerca americana]